MWSHGGSFGEANWVYRKSETGISDDIGQTGPALEPSIRRVLTVQFSDKLSIMVNY